MINKVPKQVKEIELQLSPKNGLVVKYIKEKKIKIFSKPVKIDSNKKTALGNVMFFHVAGTKYSVTTKDQIKKLRNVGSSCEVTLKHEWRNKYDDFACAVYCKRVKIGYIPKDLNRYFILKAQKRISYKFYVCDLETYEFEESIYGGPLVVAVLR